MTAIRYDPPTRVAVVCYLLFCSVALQVVRVVLLVYFPKPALGALHLTASMAGLDLAYALALGVCAWFMFRGANWARILFYVLCVIRIVGLFTFPSGDQFAFELGAAIFRIVVLGAVLVTRPANAFFAGRNPLHGHAPPNSKHPTGSQRGQEGKYDY